MLLAVLTFIWGIKYLSIPTINHFIMEIDDVSHALHTVKRVMGSIQAQFADGDMVSYFSCSTPDNWRTLIRG